MSELSDAPSVEVAVSCNGWLELCPEAAAIAARAAEAALAEAAGPSRFIVDITLTDDAEQRHLNRYVPREDTPTNVLAFPQRGPGAGCVANARYCSATSCSPSRR